MSFKEAELLPNAKEINLDCSRFMGLQMLFWGIAATSPPGNLDMQDLGPCLRPMESEILGVGPSILCLCKPFRGF